MQNNKFIKFTKSFLVHCTLASSILLMNAAYAAPEGKLDLTLSTHSQNKIKQLLNDPKTWQQIPKQVTLCVFSTQWRA